MSAAAKETMQIAVFPTRLRELRNAAGLSQPQLGSAIESDGTYISRLERGLFLPSLDAAVRLAVALECTLNDLVYTRSKNLNKNRKEGLQA